MTQHNVQHVEWAVRFALDEGASLLQIHPLEPTGRGTSMADAVPDALEGAYALLEVARLAEVYGDRLHVQVDLTTRGQMRALASMPVMSDATVAEPFAAVCSPLVIEPDGRCVPLEYGFPDRFALGNVYDAPLAELADRWRRDRLADFRSLCADTVQRLGGADGGPVVTNWYAEVAADA